MWHVSLPIANLARAKAFYEDVLGVRVLPHEERRTRPLGSVEFYDLGDSELHVVVPDPNLVAMTDGKLNPTAETHVAFEVADIEVAMQNLDANGIPYVDMSRMAGAHMARQIFLRDPDGNMIELAQLAR
jgi:catechol 2,3-dioxygenase-like lactoylglutathione lyase family enzyme